MGITVLQSPTGYQSAHEEVWHVVESTDVELLGFQYVFDIYKDGSLLTRVKNSPVGEDLYGVLDVGNIVRSSLDSYNLPAINPDSFTSQATLGADVFWTEYVIEYGQVSGIGEVSGNLASGTYRVYNNYRRSPWDKKQSNIDIINRSEYTKGGILTNRPESSSYYPDEPVVMSMFVDDLADGYIRNWYADEVFVSGVTYDSSGFYNKAYAFGFIPTGAKSEVEISVDYGGSVGSFQKFEFNKKCSKYETHTLVFLNAFGGYDSFTFVHGKFMMSNEKKKFEQTRWGLSGNNMVEKSGTRYNEAMKTYAVKYKEKMMLTSDVLSSEEYNWLSELINSPQVYYYSTENSEFYPVQITDTDYEFKDDRINKTDVLTLTIDFSVSQNTQFR